MPPSTSQVATPAVAVVEEKKRNKSSRARTRSVPPISSDDFCPAASDEKKQIVSNLQLTRIGLDSVEIFDTLYALRFFNTSIRLQLSDFQDTLLSGRVKTRVEGETLHKFIRQKRLKIIKLGKIRFAEVDMDMKALVPSDRLDSVKNTLEAIVRRSSVIENQKDFERYVRREEFNTWMERNVGFYLFFFLVDVLNLY